jgi:hypothetical protein
MAVNHTAAMTLYPKIQYQNARANGNEPRSIGDAWGATKQFTPTYLNYSTYAPTAKGPNGMMMVRPSILPMDVLDTWNWTYDPAKTFEENSVSNLKGTIRTGAKASNIILRTPAELMLQTDADTGAPMQLKNFQDVTDQILGNLGFTNALIGLNAYTPQNKQVGNTQSPITDRERQLKLTNWLTGLKFSDVTSAKNLQNARTEQTDRMKEFLTRLQQEKK